MTTDNDKMDAHAAFVADRLHTELGQSAYKNALDATLYCVARGPEYTRLFLTALGFQLACTQGVPIADTYEVMGMMLHANPPHHMQGNNTQRDQA